MSLERRNPVPKGLYWIDVFDPNREAFAEWRAKNAGSVKVRVVESFGPSPSPLKAFAKEAWVFAPAGPVGLAIAAVARATDDSGVSRDWVLFEVLSPVQFDQRRFGFPTIADASIRASDDTVQRPDPEPDITDTLPTTGEIGAGVKSAVGGLTLIAGVAVLAALLLAARKVS